MEDAGGKSKSSVATSMATLLSASILQTLLTGSDEGVMEEYGERNEYDLQEDAMETMVDLEELNGELLGVNAAAKENGGDDGYTDENNNGPFIALSEFCIKILRSQICGDAGSKCCGGSSNIIHDCVKSVCSCEMAFMSTCPSTQENFMGVTSLMLEAVCGPEHMHEEGGNCHGNIDESNSDEGNSNEDGYDIGVFTSAVNADDLDLSND